MQIYSTKDPRSCWYREGQAVFSEGLAVFFPRLCVFFPGLRVFFPGLAVFLLGLAVFSEGLAVFFAGLAVFSAGLAVFSAGLGVFSAELDCAAGSDFFFVSLEGSCVGVDLAVLSSSGSPCCSLDVTCSGAGACLASGLATCVSGNWDAEVFIL